MSIESIHDKIVSNVRENLHYLGVSIFNHILSCRDSGMEYDIGSKIKAARSAKKLTQEQVAELLGVSRQTISNWENEKSYPDIISVIKMSECYDVSLDYLSKKQADPHLNIEYRWGMNAVNASDKEIWSKN